MSQQESEKMAQICLQECPSCSACNGCDYNCTYDSWKPWKYWECKGEEAACDTKYAACETARAACEAWNDSNCELNCMSDALVDVEDVATSVKNKILGGLENTLLDTTGWQDLYDVYGDAMARIVTDDTCFTSTNPMLCQIENAIENTVGACVDTLVQDAESVFNQSVAACIDQGITDETDFITCVTNQVSGTGACVPSTSAQSLLLGTLCHAAIESDPDTAPLVAGVCVPALRMLYPTTSCTAAAACSALENNITGVNCGNISVSIPDLYSSWSQNAAGQTSFQEWLCAIQQTLIPEANLALPLIDIDTCLRGQDTSGCSQQNSGYPLRALACCLNQNVTVQASNRVADEQAASWLLGQFYSD